MVSKNYELINQKLTIYINEEVKKYNLLIFEKKKLLEKGEKSKIDLQEKLITEYEQSILNGQTSKLIYQKIKNSFDTIKIVNLETLMSGTENVNENFVVFSEIQIQKFLEKVFNMIKKV